MNTSNPSSAGATKPQPQRAFAFEDLGTLVLGAAPEPTPPSGERPRLGPRFGARCGGETNRHHRLLP